MTGGVSLGCACTALKDRRTYVEILGVSRKKGSTSSHDVAILLALMEKLFLLWMGELLGNQELWNYSDITVIRIDLKTYHRY